MTEIPPLLFGLAIVLLALVMAALMWLLTEIWMLRKEIALLRDHRDFWIDHASKGDEDE